MDKWKIEYGICDGTGPHIDEFEANDINQAIYACSLKHPGSYENINKVERMPEETQGIVPKE